MTEPNQTKPEMCLPAQIASDPVAVLEFRKVWWLMGTVINLEAARKHAGLTQRQLADRLGVTAAQIAHDERDVAGRHITLRRYVDWLAACGYMPREVETDPVEEREEQS